MRSGRWRNDGSTPMAAVDKDKMRGRLTRLPPKLELPLHRPKTFLHCLILVTISDLPQFAPLSISLYRMQRSLSIYAAPSPREARDARTHARACINLEWGWFSGEESAPLSALISPSSECNIEILLRLCCKKSCRETSLTMKSEKRWRMKKHNK